MNIFRDRNMLGLIPNLSKLKIKKIVSGTQQWVGVGTAGSVDITLPQSVNPEKSLIFMTISNGGSTSYSSNQLFSYSLINGTTLRLTRSVGSNTYLYVSYFILEFESGVKIQKGEITLDGVNTANGTISPVNLRKAVIIDGGKRTTSSSDPQETTSRMYFSNNTTITVTRNDTANIHVAGYQVLEIL